VSDERIEIQLRGTLRVGLIPAPRSAAAPTPAHDQTESHKYVVHYPEHLPRADDPNYKAFEAYHKATAATAVCFIGQRVGFDSCSQGSPLELHHAHVEFSLINGVDPAAFAIDYPSIGDAAAIAAWSETAPNFRWLCSTPATQVLMADGTERPIEDVAVGDLVIGHDGAPHPVDAIGRRRYRGSMLMLTPSVGLTPGHRVLTNGGWSPAGKVVNELGMLDRDVLAVRGVQAQVLGSVVGAVAVDVVDPLGREQRPAEDPGYHEAVLHDQARAVPDADVAGGLALRRSESDVPLRQIVQHDEATAVGAGLPRPRSPMWAGVKLKSADRACDHRGLGWLSLAKAIRTLYSGWVHDLSVAQSHSFIAGGIVVHNCVFHHRGHAGAHVASHSDYEAGQYVKGLLSVTAPKQ
jgi:Hom_end-associated Hint